jgi:hypothetical protein
MMTELDKTDNNPADSRTLSIQVEPSPPLIMAISQLFRQHKQPKKAIELCRHGLALIPGDMGMRLAMAMGYLDLNQKEEAWAEINSVAQELHQLASVLEKIAQYPGHEKAGVSDWFTRLSQLLARYPEATQEPGTPIQPADEGKTGSPAEKELVSDSNIISTLDNWVSQLKKENI